MRVVIQNQIVFIRYLVAGTVSVPHHSFYQQSLTKFSTLISSKTITRVKRFQCDRVFNIENSISELMPTAVHDRVTRQLGQGKFISYQKSAPVQTCFKSKVHGREIETAVSITYEVLSSQKRHQIGQRKLPCMFRTTCVKGLFSYTSSRYLLFPDQTAKQKQITF